MTQEHLIVQENFKLQEKSNQKEFLRRAKMDALRVASSSEVKTDEGNSRKVCHTEILEIAESIYQWLITDSLKSQIPVIQLMSFNEWCAAQDPEKILEWGQTTNEENSLVEHMTKTFKDISHSTKWYFYSDYVQISVAEQNDKINNSKPKDGQ